MTAALRLAAPERPLFALAPDIAAPPLSNEWESYLAHHGRSFWMAAQLIPQPHRAHVAGVYAFCRYTDDLVDRSTCSLPVLMSVVDEWEALSRAAYDGCRTGIPLLDIVVGDMARQRVPFVYVEGLMRGMRADIGAARFATFEHLERYCHNVASVVGLWLTELFGVHDTWTLERADRLGVAMQLTNIMRDVGEDWDRGRLYLPQSMLDAHGVTHQLIGELRHGQAPIPSCFAALLEELMAEADARYRDASAAIGNLPVFFRSSVAVAARVYAGIHDAIRANGYDSLRRRAVPSEATKLSLAREALGGLVARQSSDA